MAEEHVERDEAIIRRRTELRNLQQQVRGTMSMSSDAAVLTTASTTVSTVSSAEGADATTSNHSNNSNNSHHSSVVPTAKPLSVSAQSPPRATMPSSGSPPRKKPPTTPEPFRLSSSNKSPRTPKSPHRIPTTFLDYSDNIPVYHHTTKHNDGDDENNNNNSNINHVPASPIPSEIRVQPETKTSTTTTSGLDALTIPSSAALDNHNKPTSPLKAKPSREVQREEIQESAPQQEKLDQRMTTPAAVTFENDDDEGLEADAPPQIRRTTFSMPKEEDTKTKETTVEETTSNQKSNSKEDGSSSSSNVQQQGARLVAELKKWKLLYRQAQKREEAALQSQQVASHNHLKAVRQLELTQSQLKELKRTTMATMTTAANASANKLAETKTKALRKIRQLEAQVETLKAEAAKTGLENKTFEAKLKEVMGGQENVAAITAMGPNNTKNYQTATTTTSRKNGSSFSPGRLQERVRSLESRLVTYQARAARDEHEKEELRRVMEEKVESYETMATQAEQRAQSLEKQLLEQVNVVGTGPFMKDTREVASNGKKNNSFGATILIFLRLLWYILVAWPLRLLWCILVAWPLRIVATSVNLVFSLCLVGVVYSFVCHNTGGSGSAYWENMPGVL